MVFGDPYGNRTRVFAVKGRRPRPLDEGAVCQRQGVFTPLYEFGQDYNSGFNEKNGFQKNM